jgi:hypothetical protein
MPIQTVSQALGNESSGSPYGFKNRIHNGAMLIDQRGSASSAISSSSVTYAYAVDRFFVASQTDGVTTSQQVSDAPTGFTKSLKVTVTTADASLSAAQRLVVNHGLEGLNMADLNWGSGTAKTVTLSFWVKSSVTGTYSVGFRTGTAGTSYITSYVINSANTWEQKTITIPGATIGTWVTDNNTWGYLIWNLGIGSDFNSSTLNSWVSVTNGQGSTSHTSLMSTLNATWQISGIQLEVGNQATPFDYRDYANELRMCQRYYVDLANNGGSTQNSYRCVGFASTYTTTQGSYVIQVPVPMRVLPSLTQAGTMYLQNLGTTSVSSFAGPYSMAGTIIEGDFTMVGAVTANITAVLRWNNSSTQKFAYSAEF